MPQPIYLAANPVEAEIVRDYLQANGIETELRGIFSWGALGEVPFPEAYPRLYLCREPDRTRAKALIRDYEVPSRGAARHCLQCQEPSPGAFAVCWNCGVPFDE